MFIPQVVRRLRKKLVGKEQVLPALGEFKKHFDPYMDVFLAHKIAGIDMHTKNALLRDCISQAVSISRAGGKRIRPYMAYLGYTLVADEVETDEALWYALVGIELFHLFALIHDDIIDEAAERHGATTIHTYVRDRMEKSGTLPEKAKKIGDAQGILVGDVVFAWSGEALFSNTCSERLQAVREEFYRMIEGVVIGQMIDVDITNRVSVQAEEIEEKNRLKTARYTFVHPLKIGAALGGDVLLYESFFETFGMAIGTAFQVQDDLLDMFGSTHTTGKEILKDIEQGQHTYFTQYILDSGSKEQQAMLRAIFGRPILKEDIEKVQKLFIESGARDAGLRIIEEKLGIAQHAVDISNMPEPHMKAFTAIIALLRNRNS